MTVVVVTPLTMDMSAAGKLLLGAGAVGSTLTDTTNSGNITLDFDTYQNFVLTATGNITLVNPSTESAGTIRNYCTHSRRYWK